MLLFITTAFVAALPINLSPLRSAFGNRHTRNSLNDRASRPNIISEVRNSREAENWFKPAQDSWTAGQKTIQKRVESGYYSRRGGLKELRLDLEIEEHFTGNILKFAQEHNWKLSRLDLERLSYKDPHDNPLEIGPLSREQLDYWIREGKYNFPGGERFLKRDRQQVDSLLPPYQKWSDQKWSEILQRPRREVRKKDLDNWLRANPSLTRDRKLHGFLPDFSVEKNSIEDIIQGLYKGEYSGRGGYQLLFQDVLDLHDSIPQAVTALKSILESREIVKLPELERQRLEIMLSRYDKSRITVSHHPLETSPTSIEDIKLWIQAQSYRFIGGEDMLKKDLEAFNIEYNPAFLKGNPINL
jgi:hypothetical protein